MEVSRADPESRAPHRHARGCKLTLLVALQNLLLAACLLGALYVYWTSKNKSTPADPLDDVHILFSGISDISGNTTLEFGHIHHQYKMDLSNESNTRISVQCNGPYILYMYVCYRSMKGQASGTLQLEVVGSEDPLSTFSLNSNTEVVVCRGLQSTVYLRQNNNAMLRLHSTEEFKIKNVTVGFNYLLGSKCDY